MSLAFIAAGSWTCIFGYSFWQLCWDRVDLRKSRRAQAEVPAACGRLTLGAGLWGLPIRCWELFLGNFSAFLLKASAAWNAWLIKGNGFLGVNKLQDWLSWTSMHTSDPLALLLGLCDTWVQVGPFAVPVGRLSLPLGLHDTWVSCHLGFVPFGSSQDYLQY